jgi:hypothetical protein
LGGFAKGIAEAEVATGSLVGATGATGTDFGLVAIFSIYSIYLSILYSCLRSIPFWFDWEVVEYLLSLLFVDNLFLKRKRQRRD